MSKKLNIILWALLVISGCVVNPKYDNSRSFYEEQIEKYPKNAEFLRRQQKDFEASENIQRLKNNSYESYLVTSQKVSGWSVGNPDALLHIGHNTYKYHHRIKFTLVCDKDRFLPKPFGNRKVKWKVSESVKGEATTASSGEANVYFGDNVGERYKTMTIDTGANQYTFVLEGFLLVELNSDECN